MPYYAASDLDLYCLLISSCDTQSINGLNVYYFSSEESEEEQEGVPDSGVASANSD